MEPTEVTDFGDISAAADARLHAPPAEPTTTATPDTQPETPEAGPDDGGEQGAPAPGPDDEGSPEPDGEKPLTAAEVRELRAQAESGKAAAAKASKAEKDALALQYLLEHPEEYENLQAARGVKPKVAAAAAEPAAVSVFAGGPDPIEAELSWKAERFQAYVDHLRKNGKTAAVEDIQDQVEVDHGKATNIRLKELVLEERKERELDRAETAKKQEAWRNEQEASAIARTLTPLFKKYPQAASPDGQEDVHAAIISAIHQGKPVDYEAIVKRVHGRSAGNVKTWIDKKKAMASATTPASGRGGSAQGSRPKLADRLPADASSFSEYAERRARGEL